MQEVKGGHNNKTSGVEGQTIIGTKTREYNRDKTSVDAFQLYV